MDRKCEKCGVALDQGWLHGREGYSTVDLTKEFSFIRPGTPTSWNPFEAFRQGMAEEPQGERLRVSAWRCPRCGRVELYTASL
jgi:hypothetical protein